MLPLSSTESIQVETIDPEEAANDEQAPPFSVSESSIKPPPSDPPISPKVKREVQNEINNESISTDPNNILLSNMQENTRIMQMSLKEIQQNNEALMLKFSEAIGNDSKMKNDVDSWSHKLVLNESADDFNPIPKTISEKIYGNGMLKLLINLGDCPG